MEEIQHHLGPGMNNGIIILGGVGYCPSTVAFIILHYQSEDSTCIDRCLGFTLVPFAGLEVAPGGMLQVCAWHRSHQFILSGSQEARAVPRPAPKWRRMESWWWWWWWWWWWYFGVVWVFEAKIKFNEKMLEMRPWELLWPFKPRWAYNAYTVQLWTRRVLTHKISVRWNLIGNPQPTHLDDTMYTKALLSSQCLVNFRKHLVVHPSWSEVEGAKAAGWSFHSRPLQLSSITCSTCEIRRIADHQTHGSSKVTGKCCKYSWIVKSLSKVATLSTKRKFANMYQNLQTCINSIYKQHIGYICGVIITAVPTFV